jgi:hypothetical protein
MSGRGGLTVVPLLMCLVSGFVAFGFAGPGRDARTPEQLRLVARFPYGSYWPPVAGEERFAVACWIGFLVLCVLAWCLFVGFASVEF